MTDSMLELRSLTAREKALLQYHGLLSVEQLAGKLASDPNDDFLISGLALSRSRRSRLRRELDNLVGVTPGSLQVLPLSGGMLGLATSMGTLPTKPKNILSRIPACFSDDSLPEEVNHAWDLPEVRDQGERGTCVSFAMIANREFIPPEHEHLSEQHLYNSCKAIDGHNGPGTTLEAAIEVLKEVGVCTDKSWPYNPLPIDGNESQDPPPEGIETEAMRYRVESVSRVEKDDIEAMMRSLACGEDGSPNLVTVGVAVYRNAWANPYTMCTGVIYMPTGEELFVGAHAITLVGYRIDEQLPGGGAFIFRNSWGTKKWSIEGHPDGLYPPGYGYLPFAYVAMYGLPGYALVKGVAAQSNLAHRSSASLAAVALAGVLIALVLIGKAPIGLQKYWSSWSPNTETAAASTATEGQDTNSSNEAVSAADFPQSQVQFADSTFAGSRAALIRSCLERIWEMELLLRSY